MLVSEMNGIRPVDAGRQDCHDLHSWGPGVRQCYIIHDVGVKTINKFNPIPYSTLKNSYFVVYRRGLGNI